MQCYKLFYFHEYAIREQRNWLSGSDPKPFDVMFHFKQKCRYDSKVFGSDCAIKLIRVGGGGLIGQLSPTKHLPDI